MSLETVPITEVPRLAKNRQARRSYWGGVVAEAVKLAGEEAVIVPRNGRAPGVALGSARNHCKRMYPDLVKRLHVSTEPDKWYVWIDGDSEASAKVAEKK